MQKKQVVLFSTRGVTSIFNKSLVEQMSILKEFDKSEYEIVYITNEKTSRGMYYIQEVAGIEIDLIVTYDELYKGCGPSGKYSSWQELVDNEHHHFYKWLKNVSHIFCYGGILSEGSGFTREKNKFPDCLNTTHQMKFISVGVQMYGILNLVAIANKFNANFIEVCYDPCENSLDLCGFKPNNLLCVHGFDLPKYNMKRLDALQYYLEHGPKQQVLFEEEPTKEYDLVFGMSVLTKARMDQYNAIVSNFSGENNQYNAKLFIKNKYTGENTFVDRDTYLDYIKKASHTLIVPSYDKNAFSIYRFIEAVYNNCLPLIANDVNVNDFATSFGISRSAIKKITVNYDNIIFPDSREWANLLGYFYVKLFKDSDLNVSSIIK